MAPRTSCSIGLLLQGTFMLEMWLLLLRLQAVLQLLTCERHHLLPQHLLRHPLGPGLPELQELRGQEGLQEFLS